MPRTVTGCSKRPEKMRSAQHWESRQLCTTESACFFRHPCWNTLAKITGFAQWIRGDLGLKGFKRSLHTVSIHLKIAPHGA